MNEKELSNALICISDFIKSINTEGGISPGEKPEMFFIREEEGSLFLNKGDTFRYMKSLGLLLKCVNEDLISRKAVERFLQDAIFYAVDIQNNRKDIQFEIRIDQAIKTLRKSLLQKPRTFKIYNPVFGISLDGLPVKVGNVLFCIFDKKHKAQIQKPNPVSGYLKKDDAISFFNKYVEDSEICNKPVGLVEVSSIDHEAAKYVALKELSKTINVINFLGRQIPYNTRGHYNSSYLFLPGEKHREVVDTPVVEKGGKAYCGFGRKVIGPLSDFSFKALQEADISKCLEFERIKTLLEKKKKNTVEQRLISAMSWSGQAFVEKNKELAFLFSAISLEALILFEKNRNELAERLSVRVAQLLGKDLNARKNIKKIIKDLYGTRSDIVHDGKYQVTNTELSFMIHFAQNCILRILRDDPFKTMNEKELLDWFVNQTLCPKKEVNKGL